MNPSQPQDQIFQTAEKDNQDKEKSIVNDNNTNNNDKSVDDHNDVIVISDNDGNEEAGKSENDHNVSDLKGKGILSLLFDANGFASTKSLFIILLAI